MELGREERGVRRDPPIPSVLARGRGVGPQRGRCSRAAERFILSPGLRRGGEGVRRPQTYRSAWSGAPPAGLAGARRYSGGTGSSGDALR